MIPKKQIILFLAWAFQLINAMDARVEDVNDFSSKEAMEKEGWTFSHNNADVFSPGPPYCNDVPSTSFCGFTHPGSLMLSYTFSYSGTATLKYGHSWTGGCVEVKNNNIHIDSRCYRGSSSTTFDFSSGDVLQLVEYSSVLNIHSLTLEETEVSYRTPLKDGGCAVSMTEFHERCYCSNDDTNICHTHCDTDGNCKGYAESLYLEPYCHFATTSKCPSGCSKYNTGSQGELINDVELYSDIYSGCHIKNI